MSVKVQPNLSVSAALASAQKWGFIPDAIKSDNWQKRTHILKDIEVDFFRWSFFLTDGFLSNLLINRFWDLLGLVLTSG